MPKEHSSESVSSERINQLAKRDYVSKINLALIQLLRSLQYEIEIFTPRNCKSKDALITYSISHITNSFTREIIFDANDYPIDIENFESFSKRKQYILSHRHRIETQMDFMIDLLEKLMNWKITRFKPSSNKYQIFSIPLPIQITEGKQTFDFDNVIEMFCDFEEFNEQFEEAMEDHEPGFVVLKSLDYRSPFKK